MKNSELMMIFYKKGNRSRKKDSKKGINSSIL